MARLVSQRIDVDDDFEAVQRLYLERGWTDGLPVVPPTPKRVEAMLAGTGLTSDHVVAEVPPRWGAATVERLAINAVMAGCLPEYLPVIVAAVSALGDPAFNLFLVQTTTHPSAPLVIVNGPIRKALGMNSSSGAYGPCWRANATIGRAVRLVLLNIGGGYPGVGDMSTQGAPSKYGYCVAENEEDSPWQPLHVERGFQPDQSTVTVMSCEPPHNINDHTGRSAEEILTIAAGAMAITGANNSNTGGQTLLALGPEHAATIANDGFSKQEVKEWLHRRALIPLERFTRDTLLERFGGIPEGPVPMVRAPEDLLIIVLRGPGKHSSWVPTNGRFTHPVTREILWPGGG
ncbi:MAG: hypothetical protein QF659_03345 [Dehalococcoidia bacterium]|nr:hypothetical protein [Dehalococcoidia bacterium]